MLHRLNFILIYKVAEMISIFSNRLPTVARHFTFLPECTSIYSVETNVDVSLIGYNALADKIQSNLIIEILQYDCNVRN